MSQEGACRRDDNWRLMGKHALQRVNRARKDEVAFSARAASTKYRECEVFDTKHHEVEARLDRQAQNQRCGYARREGKMKERLVITFSGHNGSSYGRSVIV